ncbi:transcriptional coactivator/pterin dehydratase [Striga asiatica]|uniref:4a-hydroxytetrahydrobiopterin dehydratase n=1 Tax=Striga asiatica TaxID=4170 RepID=A0A5A7QZJ3_STRAF|nr:transcriptional coactivator/pterin dehydratase [Striga asiatica]
MASCSPHFTFSPLLSLSRTSSCAARGFLNLRTVRRRSLQIRAAAEDLIGDFGARDPFPAEIESNFADKVLGNVSTEHKILIPIASALSLAQQECAPISQLQQPMSEDDAKKLMFKVFLQLEIHLQYCTSFLHYSENMNTLVWFMNGEILEQAFRVVGWRLVNEEGSLQLQGVWKVRDTKCGEELLNRIIKAVEHTGHLPTLHLEAPNQVRAVLWTSSIGGLSLNDFIVAAKIDEIKVSDLQPRQRVWA